MTTTTRTRYNNRPTQTNASHVAHTEAATIAAASNRPAHYRLSIETSSSTTMGREGEVEVVTLVELVATHEGTGARWAYVGSRPCGTRDEALALMAAIFAWEAAGSDTRELDPTQFPKQWVADGMADGARQDRQADEAKADAIASVKPGKPGKGRKARAI